MTRAQKDQKSLEFEATWCCNTLTPKHDKNYKKGHKTSDFEWVNGHRDMCYSFQEIFGLFQSL